MRTKSVPSVLAMTPLLRAVPLICGYLFTNAALAQQPLSLTISTPRTVVNSGDEIAVEVTIKNISFADVPYGFSMDARYDYRVEVFGSSGAVAPVSKAARRRENNPFSAPSAWITGTLPPGKEQEEKFDMEDFFDLSAPDTYSIQVFWPPKSPTPEVGSNVLTVVVQPDPATSHIDDAKLLTKAQALHPKPTAFPVSLSIENDRPVVTSSKPVYVYYEIKNNSNAKIDFAPNWGIAFGVEIRDSQGNMLAVREPRQGAPRTPSADSPDPFRELGPGKRGTSAVDVTSYFAVINAVDLETPGTYSIQLYKKLPQSAGGGEARSNVVLVTIKPKAETPTQ